VKAAAFKRETRAALMGCGNALKETKSVILLVLGLMAKKKRCKKRR
jgi:hypothetical protein